MLVRPVGKRLMAAATVFVAGITFIGLSNAQMRPAQPLTIAGEFKDRTVLLTAMPRSGGAIESLQWGGTEFIDASDHGRHLQSAVSFDGLGECDNPTEAGASRDRPDNSTSLLLKASARDNVLRTESRMAYWLRAGQRSGECKNATNSGALSPVSTTRLSKTVRFLPGFKNVLEHRINFDFARRRSLAVIEVLTAYMPKVFGAFYAFDPLSGRMEPLSDGPGEQNLPVVLATRDGQYALGLLTLQKATAGLTGPGYGRFRFDHAPVTKSNLVFRMENVAAGSHRFVAYSVFGTLEDVRSTLQALYATHALDVAERTPPPVEDTPFSGEFARN